MAKRSAKQPEYLKLTSGKPLDVTKLVLPKIPGQKPGKSVKQLLHELRYGS